MDFIYQLFNSTGFMPHGHCYLWKPDILWLHVLSDGFIGLAYFLIPYSLINIIRKRKPVRYSWMVTLFGLFIFSCGATHWMSIVTVWNPLYRLDGIIKAITALSSVGTAIALSRLTPILIALPTKEAWEQLNDQLAENILSLTQREETLMLTNQHLHSANQALQQAQDQLHALNEDLEKRVAERTQELQTHEAQIRLLTDALPVLIAYIDSQQHYRFNNRTFQDWYGIPPDRFIGRHLSEVLSPALYQELQPAIRQVLTGHRVHFEQQASYPSRGSLTVSIDYIPHLENGQVSGFYVLVNDITPLKEVQQALEDTLNHSQQQNRQLRRINDDLDNFVYTASHDLKAPIANIEGLVNLLMKEMKNQFAWSPQANTLMDMIHSSIARFQVTIADLTEVSRLQKQADDPLETVSLNPVVEAVLLDLQIPIEQAGAFIEQELQDCVPVQFSKRNLKSVVYNLVSNALKYRSPERPLQLHIECRKEEKYQVLSISDNGLGMKPGFEEKIFGLFKRMHTHAEGTGIGLYIVKNMVENSGGHMTVKSILGQGSVFKVHFPLPSNGVES